MNLTRRSFVSMLTALAGVGAARPPKTIADPEGVIVDGEGILFGLVPLKPLRGVPEGARVRLRLRADDLVIAHVRTPTGIWAFAVVDRGDHWALGFPFTNTARA